MTSGLATPDYRLGNACRRLLPLLLAFAGTPAAAADDDYRFEITPYSGYRMGGSFSDTENDFDLDVRDSAAKVLIVIGRVRANTQW